MLFIERILKMLKPGGRAAIVLPQGKFNNSSLAFIREWILKKARLLAVVGLHPNTFKPHTGTKTSVLFVQKYTREQLDRIARVHDEVAGDCPDYAAEIDALIEAHRNDMDIPEEHIPEPIADLMAERFSEPAAETEEAEIEDDEETETDSPAADEDKLAAAEQKVSDLNAALRAATRRLEELEEQAGTVAQHGASAIEKIKASWRGDQAALKSRVREMQQRYREETKAFKDAQKERVKTLKAEIKALEKQIPQAERELKLLSNRGRLQLVREDDELIGALKERWIAGEVAKRLDYPIFMAVSERGGKNSSGDYEYMVDADGTLVEFPSDHRQAGQLVVDQDLVNFTLSPADLADASRIPEEQCCIAEAFVCFAQEQGLSFWESE